MIKPIVACDCHPLHMLFDAEVCRRTFDKYLAHELLLSLGLPSPPTWLPV